MSTNDPPFQVEHHHARLADVSLHYVSAGAGEPVVLLHGWPSTWYEWRQVMPLLAARFRVIAPDLRGLGDSSRPLAGYDKKTVAADLWQLLSGTLGLSRWHLVGHDWGGPVAFALAAAHPEAIRTLAIIDVTVPGIGPDISQGGKRWHHAFHMTPDLPEALVTGRERAYLTWFYEAFSWQRGAFAAADIDEYLRTYREPDALRAGFAFYRNIPNDIADNRALRSQVGALSAFGTPTVVHFTGALALSAIMSAPWPSLGLLAVTLGACGIGGLVYAAIVIRRARRQTDYKPVLEDWIFYAVLPCCTYAALTANAFVLRSNTAYALFFIATSALALLLIGIHNAWDAVMHIVVTAASGERSPQAD